MDRHERTHELLNYYAKNVDKFNRYDFGGVVDKLDESYMLEIRRSKIKKLIKKIKQKS